MSFGLYDKDWVDPDPEPEYDGLHIQCRYFSKCGCGCSWGYCERDPDGTFDGEDPGCESGEYIDGFEPDDW